MDNEELYSTDALILELKRRNDVDHIEGYSMVEYQEFVYRLKDYQRLKAELVQMSEIMDDRLNDLRNQISYLQTSLRGRETEIEKILQGIQRRDWIEAKSKGLDE